MSEAARTLDDVLEEDPPMTWSGFWESIKEGHARDPECSDFCGVAKRTCDDCGGPIVAKILAHRPVVALMCGGTCPDGTMFEWFHLLPGGN